MSQPPNYTPTTDFSQQEAINASGRSTVNTAALDTEFANIETTLGGVRSNLALIQRDDGRLADLTVEVRTLSQDVITLMGGFNLRGLWAEGETYAVNDICSSGAYTYCCTAAHTAGPSIDLTKWIQFGFTSGADAAQAAAAAQTSANSAAASASTATSAAMSASNSASSASNSASSALGSASIASAKAGEASASATAAVGSAAAAAASATSIDTSSFANKSGINAIGTWPISITGSAATAASATNSAQLGGVPAGSYVRTVNSSAPDGSGNVVVAAGVTSVNGNTGAVTAAQIAAAATAGYGYTPANPANATTDHNHDSQYTGRTAIVSAEISYVGTVAERWTFTRANGTTFTVSSGD